MTSTSVAIMDERAAGTLMVAAAPIGCPADASPRLTEALATAPVIAAEDTRRVRRLAAELGVRLTATVVSCYEAVEERRAGRLIDDLLAGRDVLLVTDSGMPGVSDPGYRLVTAVAGAGIRVTVLPGPSAVTAALAVSGLPSDRFCFEGFPPRRGGDRARRFAELATEPRTLVFFESRRRLAGTLAELASAFGPQRRATVCRELTKTHEEIRRGTLGDLAEWAEEGVLGEVTIVVGGAAGARRESADPGRAAQDVARRQADGMSRKDAIAAVAAERGMPKRVVYDAVVAGKNKQDT